MLVSVADDLAKPVGVPQGGVLGDVCCHLRLHRLPQQLLGALPEGTRLEDRLAVWCYLW